MPSILHALSKATPRRTTCWKAALVLTAVLFAAQPPSSAGAATPDDPWMPMAPTSVSGYTADFVDNFNGPLNTAVWGRYQGGALVHGTHSAYDPNNIKVDQTSQVADGVLQLNTKKTGDSWTSGGMSSGRGFSASQGKWTIKAKFDRAPGVGYAFLLYPKGGGWPPEIDIMEGTAGGPHIMSTLHHGPENSQIQRWLRGVDMTKWHTYGVVMTPGRIGFTIDGREWASIDSSATPNIPMWFGIQAGVKDCSKSTGECLSSATPASSNISIDWVAHYRKS